MPPDVVTVAIPAFAGLLAIEMLAVRVTGRGAYAAVDTAASLAMGFGNLAVKLLAGGLVIAAFSAVYALRLIDIPWAGWSLFACFLLEDLAYYVFHRVSHERRWFWASHVVHHSSQHYNLSTALRQTWTGNLSGAFVFWLPLVWIGFPPAMVLFFGGVSLVYQFWIHTELVGRLGPLEWILNTPTHHRVHHATNPRYLDANYGGVLIIWDRLFGSFVALRDDDPPAYGLITNLRTFNPLRIATHEWAAMLGDLGRARSLRQAAGYLWGPPGWSPDGTRRTTRSIKAAWRAGLMAQ